LVVHCRYLADGVHMGILLRVLIRTAILAAGWAAYTLLVGWLWDDDGGANIGAGLLAFGLVLVVAVLGGFVDGRRYPLGTTVGVWVVSGALLGLFASFMTGLSGGSLDSDVFQSDAMGMVPFFAFLVAIPSMIGGIFGSASSGHSTADT
jgi:hypothetical protein